MPFDFSPKNIIVRMPNWLGDLVMATPILKDLKKAFPKARLTAMCQEPICSLLQSDSNLDELFCFHKSDGTFFRRNVKSNVIEKLVEGEYDLGILLTHSFRSAWWFFMGKVRNRLGFSNFFRRPLLNLPVAFPTNLNQMHQILVYKTLLAKLQIPLSETTPYLVLAKEELDRARELLQQRGYQKGELLIGINAGASYGSAKCWLPERFREVALRLILEKNACVLFLGDDASAPLVKTICEGLPSQAIDMAGRTTIRELSSLIHECDLLLTNDSGPMHIASALEVPLVALFGSTSAVRTGPSCGSVICKKVSCSPCFCRMCPKDFRCMKEIQVSEVMDAISQELARKKKRV
jgi:heptosyltransferase II